MSFDSELLSQKRCLELFHAVEQAALRAGVRDVEATLSATDDSLTRFANNAIHQNVSERSSSLSVRTVIDGKTARATTNRLHRDGIQAVVDEAIALTKASNPIELQPLFADDAATDSNHVSEAALACGPIERARGVADAVRVVANQGHSAAGIYAAALNVDALLNSRGVFRYYADTLTQFSITATAPDSSGWAKATSPVHEEVRPEELARSAATKASVSARPADLAPGRYTVILEPAAVLDLVGQVFSDFSGTAMSDQRSFLNDRLGERLFGANIQMFDDASHPLQSGTPFDGEGMLRRPLRLVENGTPTELAYSRASAALAGCSATGHGFALPNESGEAPVNIVIAGGNIPLEELIASTENGILVTRFWYIREVEPYDKVMTGMTRDGTFLIRAGEVVGGIRNFRFNQSVVEMLRNVESMSPTVRASGEEAFDMAVPAMKVHEFTFTETTTF